MTGQGHAHEGRAPAPPPALLVSAHGVRLLLEAGAPALVVRHLRSVLPDGMATPVRAVAVDVEARYAVRPDADGTWLVLRDGTVVDRARVVAGAAHRLRSHLELDLALRARDAVFVHAAVVAWRGRAVLLPGVSGAGKSTLVAELVGRGATYYSDEYAVLDTEGLVHPYARRIGAFRRLADTAARPPIAAAVMIATHYVAGAKWAPAILEGARAVLPLLDHVLAMEDEPRRALRVGARLGPALIGLRGPRPEAAEVAPAIIEFVDRVLDGRSAQAALADAPRLATERTRAPRLLEDPGWVPVAVSARRGRVRFRRYERPFHVAHAAKTPRPWDVELSLDEIAAAALPEPSRVGFVYHHGYAGSTLLCRLLDVPGVCLVYDEPAVHVGHYADPAIRRLFYRTFRAGETPLIKTLPSEIATAPRHFADHAEARGVFLYAPLEEYVGATLAHAYRRDYVTRMARTLGAPACEDAAAAAVACWQRIADTAIALAAARPLRTLDANAFFAEPERQLARVWAWWGFPPRDDWRARLAQVAARHAKSRRPFTFADRERQRREYAEHARDWAAANGAALAAARATLAQLARVRL